MTAATIYWLTWLGITILPFFLGLRKSSLWSIPAIALIGGSILAWLWVTENIWTTIITVITLGGAGVVVFIGNFLATLFASGISYALGRALATIA